MKLMTEKILADVEDGIGWLTFNQPEKRNAMSMEMWQGVADAFEAFQADAAVRVVVMRGAGGKAFVSGADISEFDANRANAEQKAHYNAVTSQLRVSASAVGWPWRSTPTCALPPKTRSLASPLPGLVSATTSLASPRWQGSWGRPWHATSFSALDSYPPRKR
jgi:hypothetical protein